MVGRWWRKEEKNDGREEEGEDEGKRERGRGRGKGSGKGRQRKGRGKASKWREEFALARSIVVAADAVSSRFVGPDRFGNG
jgi:hypothetical protein